MSVRHTPVQHDAYKRVAIKCGRTREGVVSSFHLGRRPLDQRGRPQTLAFRVPRHRQLHAQFLRRIAKDDQSSAADREKWLAGLQQRQCNRLVVGEPVFHFAQCYKHQQQGTDSLSASAVALLQYAPGAFRLFISALEHVAESRQSRSSLLDHLHLLHLQIVA